MRNLRNLKQVAFEFELHEAAVAATAWDGDDLICAFGPSESSHTISLKRLASDARTPEQAVSIASWDAPPPTPELSYDRILNLHCFAESGLKCLILEGGDLIVVREDAQPGEDLISIVGSVDAGISAAAWSPDQELLVIATKADTVLFMTQEFEVTASIALTADDLAVSNHVSVGWGKSETQFKGRGAKALRDPTVPERIETGKLSDFDDGRLCISWRGDSQFVALNSILRGAPDRRVIRVYTRDGILDSVSEPVDGLESALSWKPSGQLIAGIQRLGDYETDVVFFERNGLRHGEFSLRLTNDQDVKSIQLQWNVDSSILAVLMQGRVQLWTMGNYHYYLKQEVQISTEMKPALGLSWNAEHPLQLSCFAGSSLRSISYASSMCRGSVMAPDDQGFVLVIDGRTLKLTPLRLANVPPPLALEEIELPDQALDAGVNSTASLLAVLHPHSVSIWNLNLSSQSRQKSTLRETIHLDLASLEGRTLIHRQIHVRDFDSISILSASANSPESLIYQIGPGGKVQDFTIRDLSLFVETADRTTVLVENYIGDVYEILEAGACHKVGKLAQYVVEAQAWRGTDSVFLFGLSANGTLHIHTSNQTQKITGCTSFDITASHLMYTTTQHLLKFVHLQERGELEVPANEPEKDERCRNIERGAKLVTVMPSAYSLVLQMPRGNLETIYPRALVLAGIRHALDCRQYKRAFAICRTQRVDMNILHDYAPSHFLQDVSMFIAQLKKPEFLDLFLSSLSEEDVTQTVYRDTMISASQTRSGRLDESSMSASLTKIPKVNKICDAFLASFGEQASAHVQSIITAHVCKCPPDLEAGLAVIADVRRTQDQDQVDRAIGHICFLADVNQLYDAALGLYDLEVALLVAQQSQKDPREYLPYLQRLQDFPALRRQFAIDNDLKRYSKALRHLHAIADFEELKSYTSKHKLHSLAVELYRYDSPRLTELMRLCADHLSQQNQFKESGIAFEYVGDHGAASEAYRAGGLWRECLSSATLDGTPPEKLRELAQDLVAGLEESKDFVAAATVSLEYLQALEPAVQLWCKGFEFSEAIRQISLRQRTDLLRDVLDPGLIEASATMSEMLAEMKSQIKAQVPRLRDLRQKKAEDPMSFLDGGGENGHDADIPDNISLAPTDTSTSGGTFMTRYTNRSTGTLATNATRKTSKNRRREERKRAKGKKGTIYEEEYLVNSIARLIERLSTVGQDVTKLIEGLMRRAMRERAVAVENVFGEVEAACRSCMDEVFGNASAVRAPENSDGEHIGDAAARPMGGEGVLWDAMNASQQTREAPILKSFDKLSLIG